MLVELHCHSSHSDGMPSARDIISKAEKTLGAVAISDHNTMAGYLEAKAIRKNVLLIPAVEMTCHHGERVGHVIALGVEEFVRGNVFEVLDFVKQSGGVSIIAHPFRGLGYSFHEKEIWRRADAIEVLNGNTLAFKNTKAYKQALDMRKPMTSGSDAHWLKFVGKYACEIDADSVDEILNKIKKGQVTLPQKSTNAFSILLHGTVGKSKRKLRKIIHNDV
jgi:predicted metal-dependent phosphoesterase TrpH